MISEHNLGLATPVVERKEADPIITYRGWYVTGAQFGSLGVSGFWEDKPAHCKRRGHSAPQADCSCGYWSFASFDDFRRARQSRGDDAFGVVLGAVAIWGQIFFHSDWSLYRSQHARPLATVGRGVRGYPSLDSEGRLQWWIEDGRWRGNYDKAREEVNQMDFKFFRKGGGHRYYNYDRTISAEHVEEARDRYLKESGNLGNGERLFAVNGDALWEMEVEKGITLLKIVRADGNPR